MSDGVCVCVPMPTAPFRGAGGGSTDTHTHTQTPRSEFIFALRAIGPGPDEALRVRKLLKELGRKHGLRVTFPDPATAGNKRPDLDAASEARGVIHRSPGNG